MRPFSITFGAIVIIWLSLWAPPVAAVEGTIVYLKCTTAEGAEQHGTGVIVTPQGHVLTARHVAPDGSKCAGSIGVADPNDLRQLVLRPTLAAVDASLLQFTSASEKFDFMRYCPLEDSMLRREIFVAGFPGGTQTGAASFRKGVLSTVFPNPDGFIETDGQTIDGMSGGPVFSNNLAGLIGIVIGANFTRLGSIDYYAILPVSTIAEASTFGLVKSDAPCYHNRGEVDFAGKFPQWNSGDAPRPLGVHADEGVCFLGKVWGQFNAPEDTVGVELQDGEYVLTGENRSGGQHGASARCIWYD